MSWYKTGTISVTNGSPVITGVGTLWVDVGILNPGDIQQLPDGKLYEILSIQSNTGLTLASNYLGTTAATQPYSIMPIGLLPSALAQQVKAVLTAANASIGSTVRYDINTQGLTTAQQLNARQNIAALSALDVGAGALSLSVAGGVDVSLTTAQASNLIIIATGTLTANINLIVPSAPRVFFISNQTAGAFTLTVKTAAGTGLVVNQGGRALLEADGTNVVDPLSYRPGVMSGSITLNGMTGVTITHNKGDTNYLVKILPTGTVPADVGEISYVKAANTVAIYNSGRPNLPSDYELSYMV